MPEKVPPLEVLGEAQRGFVDNRDELIAFATEYHDADMAGFAAGRRKAYRGLATIAIADARSVATRLQTVAYDASVRHRRQLPEDTTAAEQKRGTNNLTSPAWNLLDLPHPDEGVETDALLLGPEGQLFRGTRRTTDQLTDGRFVDGYRGVKQLYHPNGRPLAELDGVVTPHLVRVSLANTLVRNGLV